MAAHEDFSRARPAKGASNRAFGWTFVVVFLIVGLSPLRSSAELRWWAVIVAAALTLATIAVPAVLTVPNRVWGRFGTLLHRLVSPVALAVMFFFVMTPMGLVMRAFGKDSLRLRRASSAGSYWITRDPPGPAPKSMSRQF